MNPADTDERAARRKAAAAERQARLDASAALEIARLGLTTDDLGLHHFVGYFCKSCTEISNELNSYDECRGCCEADVVAVYQPTDAPS